MVKRKKSSASAKNTQTVLVIIGVVAVFFIGLMMLSKVKKQHPLKSMHSAKLMRKERPVFVPEPVDTYIPNENLRSVEVPLAPVVKHRFLENLRGSSGKIAIIIDDWGQSLSNCKYLKDIHEPVAVSILPGLRHTKDVANCAQLYHKLTMLHLPLEALHNYDFYPPNYIIKTSMSPDLAARIINADLDQLPSIQGVNNHMGSKATEDEALMRIVFREIRKRGLFFVDSMTARATVCAKLSQEMGLSFGKRDIFLDNINTREAIMKQILLLAQKARRRGYAVAIGHDRHLTMQVLKDEIPFLEKQGFRFVSIKDLLKN